MFQAEESSTLFSGNFVEMRSESSNYMLGRLDKMLVLKFVLKPVNPDTEFEMICGRAIKTLFLRYPSSLVKMC